MPLAFALQARAVVATTGHAQQSKGQAEGEPEAVRLAAPGMARLTANADGLVVHHCLANRRDLHAEYPPGAAPDPDGTESVAQDSAVGGRRLDSTASFSGATGRSQLVEPSQPLSAQCSPMASSVEEQGGEAAVEGKHTSATQHLYTVRGRLQFPWECGPLLEALLHGSAGAGAKPAAFIVAELPAPMLERGFATTDVVRALITAGILVAA